MSWFKPKAWVKKSRVSRLAPGRWPGVRLATVQLEDRVLPRPTLFVDFGDALPNGTLTDTTANLVSAQSGTNPRIDGPDLGFLGSSFTMTAFNKVYAANSVDPEGDRIAARAVMMALTKRMYAPFDIDVVELIASPRLVNGRPAKAAASLADISVTLGLNEQDSKNNDSYILVGEFVIDGNINPALGLFGGIASATDVGRFNNTDGTALVCLVGEAFAEPFGFLASQIVHESGHLFGMKHAFRQDTGNPAPISPAYDALHESDVMSYLSYDTFGGYNMFPRFPMMLGNGNTDVTVLQAAPPALTAYDQMASDPNIGPAATEYVTGTGAHDIITITTGAPGQINVLVEAFENTDFTGPITVPGKGGGLSYGYTIPLGPRLLVDAGARGDKIVIDARLGTVVSIRGMHGDDVVVITGTGAEVGTYTPGTNTFEGLDFNQDLQGTFVSGSTVVNMTELERTSTVFIQDMAKVTFTSPGGKDDLTVSATKSKATRVTGTVAQGIDFVPVELSGVAAIGIDSGNGDLVADEEDRVTIDISKGNPIPSGGLFYDGGSGVDTIRVAADIDFTLSASELAIGKLGSVGLNRVERAELTGGKSANVFTVTDWAGAAKLTGNDQDLARVVNDANFTLAGKTITASNGLVVTLNGITTAEVLGGPGANTFTVNGFTGTAKLDGMGGPDVYNVDPQSPTVTVNETGTDAAIDTVILIGTDGADVITLTRTDITFSGNSLPLPTGGKIEAFGVDGRDGNDTITVDASDGLIAGVTLKLSGGAGTNKLSVIGNSVLRVGQASLALGTGGPTTLIYDPDGSSGPLQTGAAGKDAMTVVFTGFEPLTSTIPVNRFDVQLGPGKDAIAIDNPAPFSGVDLVGVTAGAEGIRLGRTLVLTVHGGAGSDSFLVNLPSAAGLTSLNLYGFQVPGVGSAKDDKTADTFEVRAAAVGVSLFGQGGDDAFTIGVAAGGADGVTAQVKVEGADGKNTLTLNDAGSKTSNANVRIAQTITTGLLGPTSNVPVIYTGISRLTIHGSNANAAESFTVDAVSIPFDLFTGGGPDNVVIQTAFAPFTVDTGAGDDTITATDSSASAAVVVRTGGGTNVVSIARLSAPAGLTVIGGAGADAVTIEEITGPVTIDGGDGNDKLSVTTASASVAISGGSGNNVVTIRDANNGGAVTVTGGAGIDDITLESVAGPVAIDTGAGNNRIQLRSVTVPTALTITTGAGNDFVQLIEVSAPGGATVTTGAGNDSVTVDAVRALTVIETGDGGDTVSVGAVEAALAISTGAGDDDVLLGGPTLDSVKVIPAIDGGPGTDRVTLVDSGNKLDTIYTVTAAGISRGGRAPFFFTSIEASGLEPGTGNNTYFVTGTPAGGVVLRDGPGNGTFVITSGALNGMNTFSGGAGNDSFTIDIGAGVPPAGLFVTGDDGTDSMALTGRPGDDAVTFRLTAAGAGTVAGLGGNVSVTGLEDLLIDGSGGTNSLTVLDETNTTYGSPLAPETGIVVRATGAGAAEVRIGGSLVRYFSMGDLTLNGDPDGSGDADVLTVLGFSSNGLAAAGPLADATADDGSDRITLTDRLVVLENQSLGSALRLTLGETNGVPTFGTVIVRAGNEAAPGGDNATVTPSDRVNLVFDGMGPDGAPGSSGDSLFIVGRGVRTVEAVPEDPALGPAQTRLTIEATGVSVGYNGFEGAPRPTPRQDGVPIIAVASGPGTPAVVRVFEPVSGAFLFELRPYAESFLGGVSVATADVTGDGVMDVIVGAGPGGGPHVQIFDGVSYAVVRSFFAYEPTFSGGVQVSVGDVDGDGVADIILGTGLGGGPRVQVMSGRTGEITQNYFAYESTFRNGVQVAAGDVNGDGVLDVIAGAGVGGGPRVRAFSGFDGAPLYDFFAYDDSFRTGINVAAGDIDADGFADIITGPGTTGLPVVRAFSGATGTLLTEFSLAPFAADPSAPQPGIRVTTSDADGDGIEDIITAPGPGVPPVIRAFRVVVTDDAGDGPFANELVREQLVFDGDYPFGVFVG